MNNNPSSSFHNVLRHKSLPQLGEYFDRSIQVLQNVKHVLELQTHIPSPEEEFVTRELKASAELLANDCIAIQNEVLRRAELN